MKTRWMCALVVISAACKHSTCQDERVPNKPVQPRPAQTKQLTVDEYEQLVYGPGPQATFQPTTATEHDAIARLVPKLLEGAWAAQPPDPNAWQADAAAAGFRIDVWTIGGDTYWALLEAEGHSRGAGAYIFRVAPRDKGPVILLEAPHNFYDMGTGRLAADLFFAPKSGVRPRALFTNTIHRYQLAPGNKKKQKGFNPPDVAHNPEHGFSIATEAFAIAASGARVIQVHGFGSRTDEDDDDGDPGSIAAVVSAGDASGSSPISSAIAAALAAELGNEVKRFPEDVKLLGATTNAQMRMLKKVGKSEFVHVEMSSELRKRLAASGELRGKLAQILFDTEAKPNGQQ